MMMSRLGALISRRAQLVVKPNSVINHPASRLGGVAQKGEAEPAGLLVRVGSRDMSIEIKTNSH